VWREAKIARRLWLRSDFAGEQIGEGWNLARRIAQAMIAIAPVW